MTWADQIRLAVNRDGRTPYTIAKVAKVDATNLRRFLDGRVSLTVDVFERVAETVGWTMASKSRSQLAPARVEPTPVSTMPRVEPTPRERDQPSTPSVPVMVTTPHRGPSTAPLSTLRRPLTEAEIVRRKRLGMPV